MASGTTVSTLVPGLNTLLNRPQYAGVDLHSRDVPVTIHPPNYTSETRFFGITNHLFAAATGATVVLSLGIEGAASGTVQMEVAFQRKRSGDGTADNFVNTVTGNLVLSSAGIATLSIAVANAKLPSLAAGDNFVLRVRRLGDQGVDTATNATVLIRGIEIRDT